MSKQITYEVHYQYYQYNSGIGDNGIYQGKRSYSSLAKAQEIVKQIKQSHKETESGSEQSTDIIDMLIPYDGFFQKDPQLFEVITERKLITTT